MGKAEAFYQKFMASRQESVRLELALQGYFLDEEMPDAQRRAFEEYLR